MKITLVGDNAEELTIEYVGENKWYLKMGKIETTITDIEKSMEFLKGQAAKS
jgi:hypothetical protein